MRLTLRPKVERLIARLNDVAHGKTDQSNADDAAYLSAQLRRTIYQASGTDEDKREAVTAYLKVASLFPQSRLADDALLEAAHLTNDLQEQQLFLRRVMQMGHQSDRRDEAAHLLHDNLLLAEANGRTGRARGAKRKASGAKANNAGDTPSFEQVEVLPERPPSGARPRNVLFMKHERRGNDSVVRIRLSGEVGIMRGEVPAGNGQPRRIYFDLVPVSLGARALTPLEVNDGSIGRVRAGQYDADVARIVMEVAGTEDPVLLLRREPFEIQLATATRSDATTQEQAAAMNGEPEAPKTLTPPEDSAAVERVSDRSEKSEKDARTPSLALAHGLGPKVHRIVLDAGHGGHDSGAIGPSGIREKDITLAIARRIRARIRRELPDVEVLMTRNGDETLALQERTNIANSAGADLFISIHCNASPFSRVRGVETYYLNMTHDQYAMKLAARENEQHGSASLSDLDFILADLAMKSNVDDSVRLGRQVQKSIVQKLRSRWDDVTDLGLKHALFYVLMGNHMPSILVETSFLSNRTEERRLSSTLYQEAISDGLFAGIRGFIQERQAFYTP